jgi:bifunctional non-homologous end joining protein LigD
MSVLREIKRRIAASKAAFVEPCLPTLADRPPSGAGWIHEIKHDGFRLQARRDVNRAHLITRNGHDWTSRYPSIAAHVASLPCRTCTIDGEVVMIDDTGLAVFDRLRYGPREKPGARLYAFDLIELDGNDLRSRPIEARKATLAELLPASANGNASAIRLVDHIEIDDGPLVFEHACALGCEGIVSKRLGSPYRSGRTRDWIKVKNPAAPGARRLEEEDWNDRRRP